MHGLHTRERHQGPRRRPGAAAALYCLRAADLLRRPVQRFLAGPGARRHSSCTTSAPPWSIWGATSASSRRSTSTTTRSRLIFRMSEIPFSSAWLASMPLKTQRAAIQAMSPEQLQKFRQQWTWWSGRPPLPRRGPRPNTRPDRWNTRRFTRIGRRRRTRPCPHPAPAASRPHCTSIGILFRCDRDNQRPRLVPLWAGAPIQPCLT